MANVDHSSLTGDELHDSKITIDGNNPVSGSLPVDFNGQLRGQVADPRYAIYGSVGLTWVALAGRVVVSSGVPSSFTPDYPGQFYYDLSAHKLYISESTDSSSWYELATGTAVGGGGS